MNPAAIRAERAKPKCCCGGSKTPGRALCYHCRWSIPSELRAALEQPEYESGYVEAYREAIGHLRRKERVR